MKLKHVLAALGAISLVLGLALSVKAEKAKAGAGSRVQGSIAAVDAEKKTLTVKSQDGEKTVAVPSGAAILKLTEVPLTELADGQAVIVIGKRSADKQSMEARLIVVTQASAPGRKVAKREVRLGLTGTLAKAGDTLSVKARTGTVTLTTSANTKVAKEAPATFADLTVGADVLVATTGTEAQLSAAKVFIVPAGLNLGGKGAKAGGKGGRKKV